MSENSAARPLAKYARQRSFYMIYKVKKLDSLQYDNYLNDLALELLDREARLELESMPEHGLEELSDAIAAGRYWKGRTVYL